MEPPCRMQIPFLSLPVGESTAAAVPKALRFSNKGVI